MILGVTIRLPLVLIRAWYVLITVLSPVCCDIIWANENDDDDDDDILSDAKVTTASRQTYDNLKRRFSKSGHWRCVQLNYRTARTENDRNEPQSTCTDVNAKFRQTSRRSDESTFGDARIINRRRYRTR